jgi:nucleoside-diphosphate-sugar epimerase
MDGMVGPVRTVTVIGSDTSIGDAVAGRLITRDIRLVPEGQPADTRVYVSSAMVYGAWPNNPVPLTEDAPMRPNPGFGYATARAEAERVALEWRDATPGSRLAVLRPVTVLGGEHGPLTRLLRDVLPTGVGDAVPPVQYLHRDDLLDAVVLACEAELDGVFNVAPDGWMSEEEARALTAGPLRVRVPAHIRRRVPGLGPSVPPDVLPYLVHPWVVANDRLRAAGWAPRYTSEEAFVAGAGVPGWQSLSLGRRQAIAFGGVGAVVAGAVAGAIAVYRRRTRS